MMKQIEVAFLCEKKKCNCKFTKKKPSPSDISYPKLSPNKNRSLYHAKRSFLSASSITQGSMTVEAALVVPLFLFFLLNLIFYIEIFRLHSLFSMALHETGNTMAIYGHIYDKAANQDEEAVLQFVENVSFSYLYVKQDVIRQLGKEYLDQSPLTYGTDGMNFLRSKIMDDKDIIDIVLTYRVSPLIDIAGFPSFYMINRYYGRAYTGYELEQKEETEQYVYLAENGKVYHISLDCTHLKLSIKQVESVKVSVLRNKNGEKYTACTLCETNNKIDNVYITEQGNRYHGDIHCSGLKRTVTAVPVSAADNFPMCTRCQQQEEK